MDQRVRRICSRALLLGLALLLLVPGMGGTPSEPELKAAYIFNILRFVERRTPGPASDTLFLGVHAGGAVGDALRTLDGSVLRGRKLRIREVDRESEVACCEVLFVGRQTGQSAKILARAGSGGVLTIGNEAGFVASGGVLGLVVEAPKVVVEVNPEAASAAGWTISSHLLEVARVVKGAGK